MSGWRGLCKNPEDMLCSNLRKIHFASHKCLMLLVILVFSGFAVGESEFPDCSQFFEGAGKKWPSQALLAQGLPVPGELYHVEGYLEEALETPLSVVSMNLPFVDRMFSTLQIRVDPKGESYSLTVTKTFRQDAFVDVDHLQKIYRQTKQSWTELMRLKLQGALGELEVAGLKGSRDELYQLESDYIPGLTLFDLIREQTATGYVIQKSDVSDRDLDLLERFDQALTHLLPVLEEQYGSREGLYVTPVVEEILGIDFITSIQVMDEDEDYLFDLSLQHTVYDPLKDRLVLISPL